MTDGMLDQAMLILRMANKVLLLLQVVSRRHVPVVLRLKRRMTGAVLLVHVRMRAGRFRRIAHRFGAVAKRR